MRGRLYSISEASELSGVAEHRIHYAIKKGFIKQPLSLNGRRGFTSRDIDGIREHFKVRVLSPVDEDGFGP